MKVPIHMWVPKIRRSSKKFAHKNLVPTNIFTQKNLNTANFGSRIFLSQKIFVQKDLRSNKFWDIEKSVSETLSVSETPSPKFR